MNQHTTNFTAQKAHHSRSELSSKNIIKDEQRHLKKNERSMEIKQIIKTKMIENLGG